MNQGAVGAPGSVTYVYSSTNRVTGGSAGDAFGCPQAAVGGKAQLAAPWLQPDVTLPTNVGGDLLALYWSAPTPMVRWWRATRQTTRTATAQINVAGAGLIEHERERRWAHRARLGADDSRVRLDTADSQGGRGRDCYASLPLLVQ